MALRFIEKKFLADEITLSEAFPALLASVQMVTADLVSIPIFEVGEHLALSNLFKRTFSETMWTP